MIKRKSKIPRAWRVIIYFYMIVILLSLLTVASYTWFSLSRSPRVSDIYMFINSVTGLEISTDPLAEEWQLQLDFREMVDETAPLRPVTWSNQRKQFYAASYGVDGRLMNYDQWQPLTDERNANKDNADGYYIKASFYARTGQTVDVSLSPAVEVSEGVDGSGTYLVGTPLWDSQAILHNNGGHGAETAVRVGIQITRVDEYGEPLGEESEFFIYEPNCDAHVNGETGYVPTPSIDNTPTLIDEAHLIRQSFSRWADAYPVQRNVVVYSMGQFLDPPDLFQLEVGQMVRIDLYVWLEGQDMDCTNMINGAQILASIQMTAETQSQSGLIPIE